VLIASSFIETTDKSFTWTTLQRETSSSKANILFLSEGNVCRSIYAEAMFNRMLIDRGLADEVACTSKVSINSSSLSIAFEKALAHRTVDFIGQMEVRMSFLPARLVKQWQAHCSACVVGLVVAQLVEHSMCSNVKNGPCHLVSQAELLYASWCMLEKPHHRWPRLIRTCGAPKCGEGSIHGSSLFVLLAVCSDSFEL
jgi:protein-tyrosine-phosphatase